MSWNNSVKLIGRLVRPAMLCGTSVKLTLAVNRPKAPGKEDTVADFIPCTTFGKLNDIVIGLQKGDELYVEGSYRTGQYQNQKGETVYTSEVFCSIVKKFENRVYQEQAQQPQLNLNTNTNINGQQYQHPAQQTTGYQPSKFDNVADDDLPF